MIKPKFLALTKSGVFPEPGSPEGQEVSGPNGAVSGNFASYADASGNELADSGVAVSDVSTAITKAGAAVAGAGTVVDGNLVEFSGTTGKALKDSGKSPVSFMPAATSATPTKTSAGTAGTFQFDGTYLYFVQASGNVFRFIPDPTFT